MTKTKTQKVKIPKVQEWQTAEISNGLGETDKFKFPRQGLALARPVIVRNKSEPKKKVVAPSYAETEGVATAINTSTSILERLEITGGSGVVEYRTASRWDVAWAKKFSVVTCVLGLCLIAIAVAAYYPDKPIPELVMWIAAAIGGFITVGLCVKSLRSAYKESAD